MAGVSRYSYFDYLRYPYVAMMTNEFDTQPRIPFVCQQRIYDNVLDYFGMQVRRDCAQLDGTAAEFYISLPTIVVGQSLHLPCACCQPC